MSLGLYMDVHVPLPITRGLRRRGVDVLTAQEDQTTRLPDPELLRRARELGRILFSQDEDLIAEAVRCQREDLDEMLGNLLDNASKWARSKVLLAASPLPDAGNGAGVGQE